MPSPCRAFPFAADLRPKTPRTKQAPITEIEENADEMKSDRLDRFLSLGSWSLFGSWRLGSFRASRIPHRIPPSAPRPPAQKRTGEQVAGFADKRTDRSTIVVWERIRQTLIERWVIAEPGGFSRSSRPPLPVCDPPGKTKANAAVVRRHRAAIP